MDKKKLQKEKVTVKNTAVNLVIILLLATIIVSAVIGLYAWAKYRSSIEGDSIAEVAKWSFKVNGKSNEDITINLADTMNKVNSVASGKIAPGTSGKFTIDVDATGSGVSLDYYIEIDVTEKPTNLMFYESYNEGTGTYSDMFNLPVSNKMITTGSIDSNEASKIKTKTIYWEWPFETQMGALEGTEYHQENANDVEDTKYAGKDVYLPIKVTGIQKNPNGTPGSYSKKFADMVHVGDVVNYDPTAGLTDEDRTTGGEGVYTATATNTGNSADQTFNVENDAITTWKVLGMNEKGEVELLGITPETAKLTLKGQAGYKNGINELNNIAKIYGYGKGASETTIARSAIVEDIDQYTIHDKTAYARSATRGEAIEPSTPNAIKYGDTKEHNFKNTDSYTGIQNGVSFTVEDINGNSQTITGQDGTDVRKTVQQTYYWYEINNYKKAGVSDKVYTMLTERSYWLGSHCCNLYYDNCGLGLRRVDSGIVYGNNVFNSNGYVSTPSWAVSAVVSLKSNIQATETEEGSGVWNLIIE